MASMSMFSSAASKLVGDAIGTSDDCLIVSREKIRLDSAFAEYLQTNEEVYLLFKAVKKEYFFTERAFVMVHGESAVGTKRLVERFEYSEFPINEVRFETAGYGISDFDCELKFRTGTRFINIDIQKAETSKAAAAYRLLVSLANAQCRNAKLLTLAEGSLARNKVVPDKISVVDEFVLIEALLNKYNPESYRTVLEEAYAVQFNKPM
jgi:hypothetical protein